MKLLYSVLLVFLFASIQLFAQTTSQTPMPPTKPVTSSEISVGAMESPAKLSKPLFEEQTTTRNIIVSARSSKLKEFAPLGFRLELFLRERILEENYNEDENDSVAFLIDGQMFPITKRLFDKTRNLLAVNVKPVIYTYTFILDIPPDQLELLRRAKTIRVVWKKTEVNVSPDGMDILQKFISEVSN